MAKSVIVTCAITGSIHTPSQSPYLPVTPRQIVEEAVAASEAGAAVLHLHARDPVDGRPTADPAVFMEFLPEMMNRLGKGHGVRFEFECYDVGHLFNLAYMLDAKLYEPPLFLQFVLGILGGVGAELDQLLHMVRTSERLFGPDIEWSVLGVGRHQIGLATHNALLGGNVRVGLEDSLYIGPGQLARSNADQVRKICRILNELSLNVATPDEVRTRLALKGAQHVRF
jgi:uncharacterized protein (DUF849 family)